MPADAPIRRPTTASRHRFPSAASAPPRRLERLRPLLWAAAYVVATTVAFSPSLSFQTAPQKAGSIATRDVVAPRDLIVSDTAATDRRRAEAAEEVLPIYDWDADAAARLERDLRRCFEKARTAARRRGAVTTAVREAFDLPIGDEALSALSRLGFSRELEDRLVAAGQDLYHGGVVDDREALSGKRASGIVLHDPVTGREARRRELSEVLEYGAPAKVALAGKLVDTPLTARERSEVAAFLAATARPNLTFNGAATAERRAESARSVETVLTKIPRGKVIVRKGDEITARTAQWIDAARASVADPSSWVKVAGTALLQICAAAVFWLDARRQRRRRRERQPGVVYASVLSTGILFALVTRGAFALAQTLSTSPEGAAWASHSDYAIPFAAGPIVASLVAGMGPALLFAAVHAVGGGLLMGQSFSFTLFAIVGSLAGIFGVGRVRSRSVLIRMGGIVAAANLVSLSAISFLNAEPRGWDFFADMMGGLAGGCFVAMFVALVLPIFEHFFHVTTDIRLLELSNQNLPILRTLALEAPGTYQHSLMLGTLAEAAAEAIGADAMLARVAGYYHDIGKIRMAEYFIENQPKGANRHDRLEPSMSALIIASHVKEGYEMGRKASLPEPILAAIREHHGTKKIHYFYQKALTRSDPAQGPVRDTDYRHGGPRPSSRVNAILMICDAVEAASRTLIEPTPAKIRSMIQTIVDDCLRDGQFDECDLTMRDLAIIVDTLERTVSTVYHHRIDYPGFEFNRERARRRSGEFSAEPASGKISGPRPVSGGSAG
ncbi:MAG TPA: HDIG domain-containing protein [Thermoanaerobaculia bacterium]|nr:HDIG domain-containing protein [Thermoanaerobaculia bacterium]